MMMKVSNGKAMEKDIKRFDYWFSHNYQELRNKLYGAFFNEDIFHDTYLYIRNIIKTNNVSLIDFEPFFIVCYKRKRKKNNEEERMQCKFFEEVEKIFPKLPNKLLFAVPNGGSRHIREAANLKRQGVTSGVSDVILLIPKKGYASLCIEFKTKKGIQSEEQKEFQRQAENCRNKYVIARSVKQGIDALKEYLL